MTTSTQLKLILFLFTAGSMLAVPAIASAARPRLAIAPFEDATPNVRAGLAEVMAREVDYGGRFTVVPSTVVAAKLEQAQIKGQPGQYAAFPQDALDGLRELADYVLLPSVAEFNVAKKEPRFSLGRKLGGLAERTGLAEHGAQVLLDFHVLRVSDGQTVLAFSAEGLESRRGLALDTVTQGWLSSTNFAGDEFRRTQLGRAFYKALGQALYELYAEFPVQGNVVALSGDSVIIDLDARAGLQAGDELTIERETAIPNAKGDAMWQERERIGSAKVIEFQPGKCLCLVLDGVGQIAEGDSVRPLVERLVLPLEADREEQP